MHRQAARDGTGRDDQSVEVDELTVVELDLPVGEREPSGAAPEPPVELEIVAALFAQHDVVGFGPPGEQLLRQRRSVVRQMRLGADRDHRAVEAVATQRLRGAQPRERHADDRDPAQRELPPRGSAGPYRDVISVLRDVFCEWPGI